VSRQLWLEDLRSPRRFVASFALICAGILAAALCFVTLRTLETQRAQVQFRQLAQERMDSLQADLELSVGKLAALGAFCESSHSLTRSAFHDYAAALLSTPDAGIQALEWAPQVPLARRGALERSARAEGLAGFEIRDRQAQGKMVRSGDRPSYFPILYAYPEAGNELALGYDDLASNAVRRRALQRAASSGRLTASARLILAQETGDQFGIILVNPVYARASDGSSRVHGRRLLGFAEGVLRVGEIAERHGAGSGVELALLDLSASAGEQQLYLPKRLPSAWIERFAEYRKLTVGGRTWQIAAYPAPGAFPVGTTYSYVGGALCLLFTLMAVILLLSSLDRNREVERLVEERSRDLGAAVDSLEKVRRGLEESKTRYRRLIEDSPDAIVVERRGKIVLVNRAALQMFKFEPNHRLEGRSLLDFVAPEGREMAGQLYRQLSAQGMHIAPREIRVLRRDGQPLDVEFSASSFLQDGAQTIKLVLRDISRRKHDEAVTARLFTAMEQVRDCIVITDPDGRIVYVNAAFEDVTGYSRAEAMGANPRILKSGRHPSEFYAQLWKVLKLGEAWRGRIINRAKDGHLFTEESTIAPVFNRTGQLINYVAVKRDVTLETELQEQLQQSQKMDAIGRLAGGVAHDFNNMLMVIESYAGMAQEALEEDDSTRNCITQILRATQRSFALTRQLLAFSRKQVLAPQVLDLNAIVTETSSMVRRLISENIELRCDLAPDLLPVKADPDQIAQVILNLCVNSRDAMPNGGLLALSTRNQAGEPGFVEISVSDSGTGISPEVQKRLFEPFFTTKERGKGTGLGLATVYGIVQQSGGHIRVQSSPGHGSTFFVYLPHCVEAAVAPEPATHERLGAARGQVLVVEDEDVLREAIVDHLRLHGFPALAAADGVEALEILDRTPGIGTVVADLIMPRMGGRALAAEASLRFSNLGFIYISGHAGQDVSQEAPDGRRSRFLQKPFAMSTLLDAILEVSGAPALQSSLPILSHPRHNDGQTIQ
jgi:two-component system cell cycle sensor histidine kinase/response regulator CckA